MIKNLLKIIICFLFIINYTFAFEDILSNPEDEKRAQYLFNQIKCLVCQGQSIKDSGSEFSIFMRSVVRNGIKAGKSDEEIINLIRSKYGDEAIMQSTFSEKTSFLWILPLLFFSLGFWMIYKKF
jgi:cytochrome c-type biogenesis protein CcmH